MRRFILITIIFLLFANVVSAQLKGITSYDNAYRNYTAGNFDIAVKYYNEYLKSYTNDDKAIFERGMCYESLRKFDEALRDYSSAIMLRPLSAPYYVSRGYVYIKTGMPQNAYDDFTRAIQYDPSGSDGYFGRVNANLDLNKYDFALSDINSAINLNNKNPLFYYTRAMIYTELNDTAKFYDDIERILNNYPGDFFSNFKSQGVILILDNIEQNINFLNGLINENPGYFLLHFMRGFNYYLAKKFVAAEEDFNLALKYCANVTTRIAAYSQKLIENCKIYSDK